MKSEQLEYRQLVVVDDDHETTAVTSPTSVKDEDKEEFLSNE